MLYWLKAAVWLHAALVVLAAIGFFYFLFRTRFWFPTYVHWLAAVALGIGFGMLALVPADAPLYRGGWIGLKRATIVVLFPGIVYFVFVFYGGQHAAFEERRRTGAVRCPHCHAVGGLPGEVCGRCGQTIPG